MTENREYYATHDEISIEKGVVRGLWMGFVLWLVNRKVKCGSKVPIPKKNIEREEGGGYMGEE